MNNDDYLLFGMVFGFIFSVFGAWMLSEILDLLKRRNDNIKKMEELKMKEIALKVKSMIENEEV